MRHQILSFCLAGLIIGGIIYISDPAKVASQLTQISAPIFFLHVFVARFFGLYFRILRFQILLHTTKKISQKIIIPVQLAGLAIANLTPGRIGEPAKALLLKKLSGVKASQSIKSIIWERILDLLVVGGLAGIFLFSMIGKLSGELVFLSRLAIFATLGVVGFLLVALYWEFIGWWCLKLLRKVPFIERRVNEEILTSFYTTERVRGRHLLLCILLSILAWIAEGLIFVYVFKAYGLSIPTMTMIGVFALSIILGLVTLLPGGIGGTEASLVGVLTLLGINKTSATVGMLVGRGIAMMSCYGLGLLSLFYILRLSAKKEKTDTNQEKQTKSDLRESS